MITGLKYPPLKSAVNKVEQLPRVLFYKATGCKNAKCAKGAEGLYNAVDTVTGKFLGSINISSKKYYYDMTYTNIDLTPWKDSLSYGLIDIGDGRKVRLPYRKEYGTIYDIKATEAENLDDIGQCAFSSYGLSFIENISDKFHHPILLQLKNVPNSMKTTAMILWKYIAMPYRQGLGRKSKRAIGSIELQDKWQRLVSKNSNNMEFNERTYRNINNYLGKNKIEAFVYAEYAVPPKKPNLTTRIFDFFRNI